MNYSTYLLNKALDLRKKGYSYAQIAKKIKIAKSTSYLWCRKIVLSGSAKERIKKRRETGILNARKTLKINKEKVIMTIVKKTKKYLTSLKKYYIFNKLLCSFLFWAEGEKNKNAVVFVNSNPLMITTFLKLFRTSFNLDDKKFRCLVHIHEYHDDGKIKKYWSDLTKIPVTQFSKSYLKPHTKKRIRDNYNGTISIRYYDYKIALELGFIYNMFAQGAW